MSKSTGKCKDCDASILWIQMPAEKEGEKLKWVPMDLQPVTRYIVKPHEKEDGRLVGRAVDFYRSHLETCTKKDSRR